jgi:alkylation response protein AidB-like acyl-CoA dehydrogenase
MTDVLTLHGRSCSASLRNSLVARNVRVSHLSQGRDNKQPPDTRECDVEKVSETEGVKSKADRLTQSMRREQVRAVFRRLPPVLKADQDRSNELTTSTVLRIFAEEGLLDLEFFTSDATAVHLRDLRSVTEIMSCLAERSGTIASIYMVNAILAAAAIVIEGTPEQKQQILPRLQRGDLELAFAMTEPEAGSDAASLATAAILTADGFSLRGQKIYTTGASTADLIIVVARVPEQVAGKRAFGLFLVPRGSPGLTIEPLPKLSGNFHASCHLTLEDVAVGPDQVLGGKERLGTAWNTLRMTGTFERLVVAAQALGLARAIIRRAIEFATSRRQFGQTIASFQAVQHALVEMHTLETGMHLFVENALSALEKSGDSTQEVCMAKYFCAEKLQEIVALGMRVMGGRSYFEFEDMSRYYREAPLTLYAGGTIEIQKMLIARKMGLPS